MLKPDELSKMSPLLPNELFQGLGRDVSEDDFTSAIAKIEKLVEESKQIYEVEDLQYAEIEEETDRLLAIRLGQKPTYSVFKYVKKK